MKTVIHKVNWKAQFNKTKTDLSFAIEENDCFVKKVSHPIAKWMIGEAWCRCYSWLVKHYAQIKSEERSYDEFPRHEKNPRRLNEQERIERLIYVKS